MQLAEKYRPKTWTEVVGQDKVVSKLTALRDRTGLAGRAYWLSGQSGTGKTTIARLIAAEVADEFFVEEVDAAALTVSELQRLENEMQLSGWGEKPGRAYLINEAHALRKPVIRQLLVMLERIPRHVVIIFTTTCDGQDALFEDCDDASPLLSRCVRLPLARQGLNKVFAERALEIARLEGLDGQPLARYERLAKDCTNNFRAMLQAIDAGELMS